MVEKHLADPPKVDPRFYVISDDMPPTKHMATGQYHTSKSKFRADTKATNTIEVGNDPAARREQRRPEISMQEIVNDVKRSIEELRSR